MWMTPVAAILSVLADVEWTVSPSIAHAGIPFTVELRVQAEGRHAPDLDVPTPEVDGLEVLDGPDVLSGSNISIVNGKTYAGAVLAKYLSRNITCI